MLLWAVPQPDAASSLFGGRHLPAQAPVRQRRVVSSGTAVLAFPARHYTCGTRWRRLRTTHTRAPPLRGLVRVTRAGKRLPAYPMRQRRGIKIGIQQRHAAVDAWHPDLYSAACCSSWFVVFLWRFCGSTFPTSESHTSFCLALNVLYLRFSSLCWPFA
jgi:hypothetical protein